MNPDADIATPQGIAWADALVETHGRPWLDAIDIGPAVPPWEAFKLCYSRGAGATDAEVISDVFTADETATGDTYRMPETFIAAFVDAALEIFRALKRH
jgi:hypothetical protein